MIPILAGIVLAAALFAALIFSVGRAAATAGRLRLLHLATALLILAGVATISLTAPGAAMLVAALLAPAALALSLSEHGGNRVLPLAPLLFAVALFMGLPFAGA